MDLYREDFYYNGNNDFITERIGMIIRYPSTNLKVVLSNYENL